MRGEPEPVSPLEDLDGEIRGAAEFPRQRPFGRSGIVEDSAEDLGLGGGADNLVDLFMAVHGEEAHAELIGMGDVAFLLDGVAIGNPIRGRASGEYGFDFRRRGAVEA